MCWLQMTSWKFFSKISALCCITARVGHSLVPRPAPFSVAWRAWTAWYPSSRVTSRVKRWKKGLNWAWAHWGSEQQEELRYQVTYHTYLASGGHWTCSWLDNMWNFAFCSEFFSITWCSCEKRYQALPTFVYCKWWKTGQDLGTRLSSSSSSP